MGVRTSGLDRATLERRLLELGLAGQVPNSREANLRAIRLLLDGVEFYTFGIHRVREAVTGGHLNEDKVVRWMTEANGLPSPEAFLAEQGTIAPHAAYEGLVAAARLFGRVVARKGTVAFGTGHPGSMTSCYNRLAAHVRARGGTVVMGRVGEKVGIDWYLDYLGDVAVTSDYCGVLHGHSTRPMEAVLATCETPVDLVVGDHGHAGAAINAGVPCIAVMDTNDPALEVARRLGVEGLVVVPLFDNRANAVTVALADLLIGLAEQEGAAGPGSVVFDRSG